MSTDLGDAIADAHRQSTAQPDTRTQLLLTTLLTVGALFAGVAYVLASWLVGLFAATLPIPAGATLGVTIAAYAGLVYLAVFDTDDNGDTYLGRLVGRVAR